MISDAQKKLETVVVGSASLTAIAIGLYAILARHFLPQLAVGWTDEVVVYLVMWAIWISASRLVAENGHVHADLVLTRLPKRWQRKLSFLTDCIGFIFCCAVSYGSWQVVKLALQVDERSESVLQFPIAFYDMSLLAGMVLMALRYLQNAWIHISEQAKSDSQT